MNNETTLKTVVDAAAQVDLGMTHFDAHKFDDALSAFEQAIVLDPNCAPAWNGIGRVNYHIGTPEAAIAAYERAIASDPNFDHAYYGIGILLAVKVGNYPEAIAAFRRGLAANPNESYLANAIYSTYARMGRFDEAITGLEQSLANNPSDTFALSWLGTIYLHQKRYDDVIAAYQREISIEEAHSPHRIIGLVYDHLGNHTLAITHLERAVALEPQDYEARAALAVVYRATSRNVEADAQDALADEMAKQDEEYGQACVQALRGNVDEAVRLLAIALPKKLVMPGWACIDPEFAFVKDDPRFKALVGE